MGRRHEVSDADWERIKDLLPGRPGQHGGIAEDNRRFVNAVLYVAKTGVPWRDLPERYGNWNSQWRRFAAGPRPAGSPPSPRPCATRTWTC